MRIWNIFGPGWHWSMAIKIIFNGCRSYFKYCHNVIIVVKSVGWDVKNRFPNIVNICIIDKSTIIHWSGHGVSIFCESMNSVSRRVIILRVSVSVPCRGHPAIYNLLKLMSCNYQVGGLGDLMLQTKVAIETSRCLFGSEACSVSSSWISKRSRMENMLFATDEIQNHILSILQRSLKHVSSNSVHPNHQPTFFIPTR